MIGFRKVAALAVVLLVAVVSAHMNGDVPPGLVTMLQWAFGLFVAGNGVEHLSDALASSSTAPQPLGNPQDAASAPPVDISPLVQRLDSLEATEVEAKQSLALIGNTLAMIVRRTGIDKLPDTPAAAPPPGQL